MELYSYKGPVTEYGRLIAQNWSAETRANSEKKARSNFLYQFKLKNNKLPNAKIELPGKITLENANG